MNPAQKKAATDKGVRALIDASKSNPKLAPLAEALEALLPDLNKGGRPPALELSDDLLNRIKGAGSIQCNHRQTAAVLGVAYQTWLDFKAANPEALEAYEAGKETGCAGLLKDQFTLAKRNAAMAIFLGKNYLGQTDKREFEGTIRRTDPDAETEVTDDMSEEEAAAAYEASLHDS